ncbi:MAG: hypothetical protein J1E33_00575 [Alistipes sp.]|nr:hypothetical protein [Alistipes sp.]
MKHLFRTILVVFAAVSLAACGEGSNTEGDGDNNPGGNNPGGDTPKSAITFATTAAPLTRTGTVGDSFIWTPGEVAAIAEVRDNSTDPIAAADLKPVLGTVSSDFASVFFRYEYNSDVEATVFDYLFCHPYTALRSFAPGVSATVVLPAQQQLTASSFDPSAAILYGQVKGLTERPTQSNVMMQHISAYTKLTVKNLGLPAGTVVSKITFASDDSDALAGTYEYNVENPAQSVKGSDAATTVILDASQAVINTARDFTVWFTTLPGEAKSYTITIVADGEEYTRQFENPVTFVSGQITDIVADFTGLVEQPSVSGTVFAYSRWSTLWEADKNFIIAAKPKDEEIYYTFANDVSFVNPLPAVSFQEAGIGTGMEQNTIVCNNTLYQWRINSIREEGTLHYYTIQSVNNPALYLGVNGETLTIINEPHEFSISNNAFVDNRENIVKSSESGLYLTLYPKSEEDLTQGYIWEGQTPMLNYKYTKFGSAEIILYEETDKTE